MENRTVLLSTLFFVCLLTLLVETESSKVLELTDRINELRRDGMWFVMFYAPWCAYCKRLEPVWNHVAQSLHKTNIRVGRVDCTRFTSVAGSFTVKGYPTIIFVKDNTEYMFNGDRIKEELINFAIRMSGPPVQKITRSESIDHLKATNEVFFLYIGDSSGDLWDGYLDVAERHQANSFFYSAPYNLVKDHISGEEPPLIAVFKENSHYAFDYEPYKNLNFTLSKWVNEERFLGFPKITKGNVRYFYQIEKYIVIAVLEENKLEEMSTDMLEFRDMVEGVARGHRDRYHKNFQFGWVGAPDIAHSIALEILPAPHLLVVNPSTDHHHIPQDDPSQLTPAALTVFLDSVLNESAPVYGGRSMWLFLFRMYFDTKTSLRDMWQGNPVLTAVLFGLPFGFFSLICYSICCADIMDAEEEDEGMTEELPHEKDE